MFRVTKRFATPKLQSAHMSGEWPTLVALLDQTPQRSILSSREGVFVTTGSHGRRLVDAIAALPTKAADHSCELRGSTSQAICMCFCLADFRQRRECDRPLGMVDLDTEHGSGAWLQASCQLWLLSFVLAWIACKTTPCVFLCDLCLGPDRLAQQREPWMK